MSREAWSLERAEVVGGGETLVGPNGDSAQANPLSRSLDAECNL